MQIVPGYDFSVNEVPNRAKLSQMAAGMTLTGIELSQVSTVIVAAFATDGSQTSLAEGAIWIDARSNMWGKTANGILRVRMSEGGWESNRYRIGTPAAGSLFWSPGRTIDIAEMIVNNTNESNCVFFPRGGGEINRYVAGILQETTPSTATDAAPIFSRVVCRGATRLWAPTNIPPGAGVDRLVMDYAALPGGWAGSNMETGGVFPQGGAETSQQDPSGETADFCYAYLFNLINLD